MNPLIYTLVPVCLLLLRATAPFRPMSSDQGRRCLEDVISLCVRPIRVAHRPLLRSAGVIHNQLLARRNRHEGAAVVLSLVVAFVAFDVAFRALSGLAAAERWYRVRRLVLARCSGSSENSHVPSL